MSRKGLVLVFGVVVLTLVASVVLLATGGGEKPSRFVDTVGDATTSEGGNPPRNSAVADIHSTEVRNEGDDVVFTAELGDSVPAELSDSLLRVRWALNESGGWTVLVTIDAGGQVAQVVGQGSRYGASSADSTLPGDFEIQDKTVTVRIRPADIPQWPAAFTWATTTELSTDEPDATLVNDRAPNEGFGSLAD